ncbi:ovalbumin-related protein Y-like [Pezoporus flaviventris]|uniref:ovalbumin-related protein Y-like n=1 Tax=Pezoporus flaviventris TaxID=889875 RepID=UPI002AAF3802|nr:ovalbumin-related protein Y-like [Pezoporus flaviventris]
MKLLSSCLKCEEDGGVHSQFQALLAAVSELRPGCSLTIANRLFGEITYPFFQPYLDSTKKFYQSELEPVNFKYTEEKATDKINFWVENETKGKIKHLFSAGFTDPSTVLVLVSAIYFKGKWAVEFKKEDTKETYFHLNKNERRMVQMMFQEGYFNMAIIEELKTNVIELLYFDSEMSMFILLPEVVCEDFTGLEQTALNLTMGSISAANAEFAFDVFKELKVYHANDNIFCSPLSIIAALAMVYLGARGNTEYQMEKALHFDKIAGLGGAVQTKVQKPKCGKSVNIHILFKELLSDITAPKANYSLHIANRLYAEKTSSILPIYLKCVKKLYRTGLEMVNFKTASDRARQLINSWVKNQTNGHIQDFLEPRSVDPDTLLVIVNAIYFKGIWKTAFKEEDTREFPFSMTKQESRPVQMMCQNSTFKMGIVPSEKIKILELPYASGELSMLVLLPDDVSGLEQLEKKINFEKLTEWTSPSVMEKKRVKVYLPRMKIEEKYNLTSVLKALGMTDLFSSSADLSGISSAKNLKISEVVHMAYMEVNEEGTEMAGSAGVTGAVKHSPESEEFKADHPFLFLIKHNPTNSILFVGRYCSP